ncbi:YajQ family cyclic di-GMP-binding protein [Kytococcus sp. CUA-901]|nr:YajQ family cyclic di-GMP-binding protein [Kytococcus sp. CUA-901]
MASESSFDVVSKVDRQEVDNAVNQAAKEIGTRYDFRNVGASVELNGDNLMLKANTAERVLAVLDVLQTKLVKRGVSLKSVDFGEDSKPKPSGKEYRLEGVLKEGLSQENAKKVTKLIRDEFGKTVKTVIQGDEVRVSSKSRDDLQAVQRALKGSSDIDAALQFTNYR